MKHQFAVLVFVVALPLGTLFADKIDCTVRGNALPGKTGTVHTVTCPLNCTEGPVWGTSIYTDDSAVCTAALHAGMLKAGNETLTIHIRGPLSRYVGSTRNDISSKPYGAWNRSFSIGTRRTAPAGKSRRSSWVDAVKYWAILGVIGIVFLFWYRARKRKFESVAAVFSQLAHAHGLSYERPRRSQAGRVSGSFKDHEMEMRTYTHSSSGNPATTYIQVKTKLNKPLPEGLRIYPRTMLRSIGAAADRLAGEKEIKSGDTEFDQVVYVGAPDEASGALLTASVRTTLVEYFRGASEYDLLISGDEVTATRTFAAETRANLENILELQNRVAAALA